MNHTNDKLITANDVAEILNINPGTLNQWRRTGLGPPFIKVGGNINGAIRYSVRDLEQYLHERRYPGAKAAPPALTPRELAEEYEALHPRKGVGAKL